MRMSKHVMEVKILLNGVQLWIAQQGEGVPIMLCSGGPGCCDYLGPIAEMIDDLVRVYRWEQCGCGRSDVKPPYDLATCIADLEGLRNHFGFEQWIIGGHSWGANLSLAYAIEHLERVQAVIYLAGTGITEAWKPEYHRAKAERGELLPEFAYPPNDEVNLQGNIAWTAYLKRQGLVERIRALDVPVLILQGERDIRPNWAAQQVAEMLPQARFEI